MLRRLSLISLSAILLTLSFPWFDLSYLAWIGFLPLFYAIDGKPLMERLLTGYIFGVLLFAGTLYWLTNVSVPGAAGLFLLLGIYPALFCVYRFTGAVHDVLVVPAFWAISEFLRGNLLTGFPWCILAHSQYKNLPVIQISDVTGAYGVSFMIVMVNFCVYAFLKNFKNKIKYATVTLFVMVEVFLYGYQTLRQENPNMPFAASVIQGNIPLAEKWDPSRLDGIFNKYKTISLEAAADNPELVIWPETAVPSVLDDKGRMYDNVTGLAKKMAVPILTGACRDDGKRWFNSAYLISGRGEISGFYDKIHIVPFGEYLPFEKYLQWFRAMINKPIGDFSRGSDFTLFNLKKEKNSAIEGSLIHEVRFYRFGVLICFEDIFPELARAFVKNGAEFLVNITNDAWFGRTSAAYQHASASVFRAVENRVPVIRSANTGFSCFISEKGKILSYVGTSKESIFVEGYKRGLVHPNNKRTYYTNSGDIFMYICVFMCILGTVISMYKATKPE